MSFLVSKRSFWPAIIFGLAVALTGTFVSLSHPAQLVSSGRAAATNLSVPATTAEQRISDSYGRLPLSFEINEGQADPRVKFLSHGPGYDLFLTPTGVTLSLRQPQSTLVGKFAETESVKSRNTTSAPEPSTLGFKLLDANPNPPMQGEDELPGKTNYLLGNNPEKWHSDISTYSRVRYRDVYPHIDLAYHGNQKRLEYDFILKPRANSRRIRIMFRRVRKTILDENGDLILSTRAGDVRQPRPVAYQEINGERHEVAARYHLAGRHIGFRLGRYNRRYPLIIDPVFIYSSFLGGSSSEDGLGIAVDAQGSAYLTGTTSSTDFPVVSALQSVKDSASDVFITKLNPAGTALIYSTYLGGNGSDTGNAIAVDAQGNAYVAGFTGSGNFPTTSGAFQGSKDGLTDAFAAKLNPSGSALVYSTFLGGENNDTALGIAVDGGGNAYVVGRTDSTRFGFFPIQRNGSPAYKSTDAAGHWSTSASELSASAVNAFALDPGNTNVIYAGSNVGVFVSTTAGAHWNLTGTARASTAPLFTNAVVIDPTNTAVIYAGTTNGVYRSTNSGALYDIKNSGFTVPSVNALAIDPNTPATLYAGTLLGIYKSTNGGDTWSEIRQGITGSSPRVNKVVLDPTNPAIVYMGTNRGMFKSTNGGALWTPINSGPLATPFTPQITALAIDPLNPATLYASGFNGTDILFKTTDGGVTWSGSGSGLTLTLINNLAVDPVTPTTLYAATVGSAIFKSTNGGGSWAPSNAGLTNLTTNAVAVDRNSPSTVYAGTTIGNDAFAIRLNATGFQDYFLNFGGNENDEARGVALDANGNAYIVGTTNSSNFPVVSAFQSTLGGLSDAFVVKLNPAGNSFIYSTYFGGSGSDQGRAIAVSGGSAYVVGSTNSQNFPLARALKSTLTTFDTDAFVTRFSPSGDSLVFSTYLGGERVDQAFAVAVAADASIYVSGSTSSSDFPTLDAPQPNISGSTDAFVTKLNPTGTTLAYSTYLGGTGSDQGNGIAVDGTVNAYVIGTSSSSDFPTVNPFQPILRGSDAFVTKIGVAADVSISKSDSRDPVMVNNPLTYTLKVKNAGPSLATGVKVTEDLPSSLTLSSATSSLGTCSINGLKVTCDIGSLPAAGAATITISVTPTGTGNITNTASVTANEPDANTANNTATEVTKVSASPSIDGHVTDAAGNALSGVLMNLTGGAQAVSVQTDSNGFYQFAEVAGGRNYTITPSKTNFSFEPESRTFNALNADQTADFVANPCTYSITPITQSFGATGVAGNVSVATLHGCPWTATSNSNWITINSGTAGVGNGIVSFNVNATTSPRAGHLTIAGQNFAVYQEFNSCAAPTFSVATYNLSSSGTVLTSTADFNGDGKPDIVVLAKFSGGQGAVLLNDGTGGFTAATIGPGESQGMAVNDFSGDGKPDLAFSSYNSNVVGILVNNGSGGFGQSTSSVPFTSQGQSPLTRGLFSADINNDGKPDLLVWTPGASATQILLGNGDKTFNQIAPVSGSSVDVPIGVVDVNGDNLPDLIFAGGTDNSRPLSVRLGNGAGGFGSAIISSGTNITGVMGVGDFDSDGKLDIAATGVAGSSNAIAVLKGDGTGRFVTKSLFAIGNSPNLTVADFNRDGKLDVAFTNGGSKVTVLLGDGLGGLGNAISIDTGASDVTGNFGLDNADFNGDKLPDVAVADASRGASVLRNSCAALPSISGRVTDSRTTTGLAGATVTLSGAQSATTQTDGSGNYIFPNLTAAPNYVVTPSKANFKFNPVSTSVNNLVGIQTANFVGTPTTFQFTSQDYVVNEDAGSIQISVRRGGDLSGVSTVDYATSDGTASARTDYTSAFGTLRFNPGESLKTFNVLITDDNLVEGFESLSLTLSNPVGAIFNSNSFEGPPNTSLLEIRDNDTNPNLPNPVDSSTFFVRQHYHDFLNREPDASGLNFWADQINSCGTNQPCIDLKHINVSAAFFLSIEFQNTGYLVERTYKAAYGDVNGNSTFNGTHQLAVPIVRLNEFLPDTQQIGQGVVVGQTGWETVLENNKQTFAAQFVQRSRFASAFATSMTPAQFVDTLFTNAGVTPTAADRNAAIAEFGSATNTSDVAARARALRKVAENSTLVTNEFNRAFVLMQYFGYLRRDPNSGPDTDYTGYDFWLTKLNQFNGNFVNAEMVKAFITSSEYRQRFGP